MSRATVLLGVLLAMLSGHGVSVDLDMTAFSQSLTQLANGKLGVKTMQEHYRSLDYTTDTRNAWAITDELASQLRALFDTQKDALQRLKTEVEATYRDRNLNKRKPEYYCCNLQNLTEDDYEFRQPVSKDHSCDRVSGIADISARSVYGELDSVYKENEQAPLKWQYFGSELGVLNQFPAGKAPDCTTYDHRFRPWYIASATPNPKDVVLIVKNNNYNEEGRTILFGAADIILRTLNPRDRVAVIIFNEEIFRPALEGCYATNLSLATPANVRKFQNFLVTAHGPIDGNNMSKALEAAFSYFDNSNALTGVRDRAIALFIDGERIDEGKEVIKQLISDGTNTTPRISLFIFVTGTGQYSVLAPVRTYLQSLIVAASGDSQRQYIELPSEGDLRENMADFYSTFAANAQQSEFTPIFLVPYYDLFGLDQLVITLTTLCFMDDLHESKTLLGVAAVDITLADLLAGVEYFREGELSYAFVIDKDGLVLFHPLLPFPSSNNSAVYLDISTLEPHAGFSEIREAMMNGSTGCKDLNVTQTLSLGTSASEGGRSIMIQNTYCWKKVSGTPFSLGVVIPVDSNVAQLSGSFATPTNAQYHRLDILASPEQQCRHLSYLATKDHSTIVFSPEAFARPEIYLLVEEREEDVLYIQEAIRTLTDVKQVFRQGILYSVAATCMVDEIWQSKDIEDTEHIVWRYIATSNGVFRIFPGIQLIRKDFNPLQRPWYQRALGHLGHLTILPPYDDGLGAGTIMTLSQSIVPEGCAHGKDISDPSCSVLAVMGVDITYFYFSQLLHTTVPLCSSAEKFRCLLIDSSGYVITHADFLSTPDDLISRHIAEMEPLLAQDMVHMDFLRRGYCHNFQYNADFTKRPRRQYSYEVTEKVAMATEPLDGGYSTYCVFYKIVPVNNTNIYLIAIDLQRSAHSLCSTLSCPCAADQPCSTLPADCTCPCTEDIPPSNYNACLESFEDLTVPACPSRFGFGDGYIPVGGLPLNTSLPLCYDPHCELRTSELACESILGCDFCAFNHSNGTRITQCQPEGSCPGNAGPTELNSTGPTSDDDSNLWQIISGVSIAFALVMSALLVFVLLWCFIILRNQSKRNSAELCLATSSEHSILDSKGLHAHNAVMELGSISSTSTSKEGSQTKTKNEEKTPSVTADPDSGIQAAPEQADPFIDIPDSLQIRGGFSDHDIKTEPGSLDASHAGGIWF